jgi:hypothetical protein
MELNHFHQAEFVSSLKLQIRSTTSSKEGRK